MASNVAPSLYIRLYIDEHVWRKLAAELRERGFDAVNVFDVGRDGLPDEEQWNYAAAEGRAFLTYDKNGGRFVKLASDWFYAGLTHSGLIISGQIERRELLHRTTKLLNSVSAEEIANTVRFLEEWK